MRIARLFAVLSLYACNTAKAPPAPDVRFEVRGLTNVGDADRELQSTSFRHHATVVALGDSVATKRAFVVYYGVRRLAGGDPENTRPANDFVAVFVVGGIGELTEYGGYRTRTESWDPERIELTPIGYYELTPMTAPQVQEQ